MGKASATNGTTLAITRFYNEVTYRMVERQACNLTSLTFFCQMQVDCLKQFGEEVVGQPLMGILVLLKDSIMHQAPPNLAMVTAISALLEAINAKAEPSK